MGNLLELTFEQSQEVDQFLEDYRRFPSNSNKARTGLHAWIEDFAQQAIKEAIKRSELPDYTPAGHDINACDNHVDFKVHCVGCRVTQARVLAFNDYKASLLKELGLEEHD